MGAQCQRQSELLRTVGHGAGCVVPALVQLDPAGQVVQLLAPPTRKDCCTGTVVERGKNTMGTWKLPASHCTCVAFSTPQPEALSACALLASKEQEAVVGKVPFLLGGDDVLYATVHVALSRPLDPRLMVLPDRMYASVSVFLKSSSVFNVYGHVHAPTAPTAKAGGPPNAQAMYTWCHRRVPVSVTARGRAGECGAPWS